MSLSKKLRVQVVGPFKLLGPDGADHTPRGRKACALIAMLALSPGHRRTRVWLQDKLWGSRMQEQGAASLRQCLSEVRRSLEPYQDLLVTDRYVLSLERAWFDLDVEPAIPSRSGWELLEGLDIGEEGFEDWLREQRQHVETRQADLAREQTRSEPCPREHASGFAGSQRSVFLVEGANAGLDGASLIADSLVDAVAKSISELGAAKVLDRRGSSDTSCDLAEQLVDGQALLLRSDVLNSRTRQAVRLALLQLPAHTLAWSSTLQFFGDDGADLNDPSILRCINQVVNIAVGHLVKARALGSERAAASALCQSGVLHLFRLGKVNFDEADRLFSNAFESEPRGIYLAWRAYLRTFLLAERQYTCRHTVEAEALDFASRALELDPHNSYVAALSAHVHTMMRRSYVAAYELAERSIQLNHANPIGWACLGIAKSYLGRAKEGFQDTLLARTIAGSAPFRYQIDALSSIAGTIAGEFGSAIHLAEASHALAPTFAPPLRYLSALYAHEGRYDLSSTMVRKLQLSEPDFSYEKLRERGYPSAGLHRAEIIGSLPRRQI